MVTVLRASMLLLCLAAPSAVLADLTRPLADPRVAVAAQPAGHIDLLAGERSFTLLALDVDPRGELWGLTAERNRLVHLAADGRRAVFPGGKTRDAVHAFPSRLFARSGLKLFTLDPWAVQLARYDLTGFPEVEIDLAAKLEAADESFADPVDFCLSRSGDLYVLDAARARIVVFADDGEFRRVLGETEPLGVGDPAAIDIDGDGALYVLGLSPPAVARIGRDGAIGVRSVGNADGAPVTAVALAVDPWGNAFVSDSAQRRIWVLPARGGAAWSWPLEESVIPGELAADGSGRVWIAGRGAARVWVYEIRHRPREASGRDMARPR